MREALLCPDPFITNEEGRGIRRSHPGRQGHAMPVIKRPLAYRACPAICPRKLAFGWRGTRNGRANGRTRRSNAQWSPGDSPLTERLLLAYDSAGQAEVRARRA